MKKKIMFMIAIIIALIPTTVFGACKDYSNKGSDACVAETEDGYKCEFDASKKGGARCYQSKNLTDEKKGEIGSTVNSCYDIKEGSEVCNNSKVNGIKCRFTHGECTNASDSDGSGETVIGDYKTTTTRYIPEDEKDSEYYTGCPLGADVTKDIYGALKIVKIVAPLLVLGLTIVELVMSVAKGDIQAETKKLTTRLVKRLIYVVILFFLPVLVNQLMIMANVWDENGTCDFSKTSEVIDDSTTSTTTTTKTTTTNSSSGGGGSHTSPSGAEHGGGGHSR